MLKLENKKHGSYQFETTDAKGNKYGFNGVIHEFVPNRKITRTFEMENTPFAKQSKTRESRVEKYMKQILNGKGLNDW